MKTARSLKVGSGTVGGFTFSVKWKSKGKMLKFHTIAQSESFHTIHQPADVRAVHCCTRRDQPKADRKRPLHVGTLGAADGLEAPEGLALVLKPEE